MSTKGKREPTTSKAAETEKVMRKVVDLIELAADDTGSPEESRTAAVQAIKLMKEHELVVMPSADVENIKQIAGEARQLQRQAREQRNQNMMLGAIGGFLASRFIRL
jgi:uncharacterized protein (UPF0147 family)